MRLVVSFVVALLLVGCSSPKKIESQPGARVGILIFLDEQAKHAHMGTTAFHNFEREGISDWNVEQVLAEMVVESLKRGGDYEVVTFRLPGRARPQIEGIASVELETASNEDGTRDEVERVGRDHGVQYAVVIWPFNFQLVPGFTVEAEGYGLKTHCAILLCRAYVLDHVLIAVYHTKPWHLAGSGLREEAPPITEPDFSGDLEEFTAEDIDLARDAFFEDMRKQIDSALERSGLVPPTGEPEEDPSW